MNKVTADKAKSILNLVKTEAESLPLRIVIYGREGVGKTSFPSHFKNPIYLMSRGETGLETLMAAKQLDNVAYLPPINEWESLLSTIDALINDKHDYKTLVIDCLNGFEELCMDYTMQKAFGGSFEAFMAYYKGFEQAAKFWKAFTDKLDKLRRESRMTIVCLAHSKRAKQKNPMGEDYQAYNIDLHEYNANHVRQWADVLMFFDFLTVIDSSGKAKGGKVRIAYCEGEAGFEAKNRIGLPAKFELGSSSREAFANFIKATKEKEG